MSEEIKRIGDYEILAELGAGGMGRVYKVRNTISDRIEAMKILLPDLAGRQELAARFLREIKLLASLNHPNIAQLRTAFTNDNQLVMIMEYVEGVSMATHLSGSSISVNDALNYIDQVLLALGFAHEHNVIHRDMKPANMMLTGKGVVKVMDFGIARGDSDQTLTQAGTSLGTVNYMSPEQVKGLPTDPRSDLYSVGVCLYEMVTGKKPFNQGSDYSIMAAHVNEAPRAPMDLQPGLPPALNQIILIAIEKDPAKRFQTATAFRNALNNVRGAELTSETASPMVVPVAARTAVMDSYPTPVTSPSQYATLAAAHERTQLTPIPPMPHPQMPPPPPSAPSSHRGLYMTLGAVIVLAALVLAGIYVPKKSSADEQTKKVTPAPVLKPKPTPQVVEVPVPEPPPKPPVTQASVRTKIQEGAGGGSSAKELDQLRDDIDQLAARAGAVNGSLDRLKQEQAASGYGLRGDMAERQESMKINLSRAQDAAEKGNTTQAKKYADRTSSDVETLEKFLGR